MGSGSGSPRNRIENSIRFDVREFVSRYVHKSGSLNLREGNFVDTGKKVSFSNSLRRYLAHMQNTLLGSTSLLTILVSGFRRIWLNRELFTCGFKIKWKLKARSNPPFGPRRMTCEVDQRLLFSGTVYLIVLANLDKLKKQRTVNIQHPLNLYKENEFQ